MRKIVIFFFFLSSFLYAQSDSTFVDNKYLEDQLYLSFAWVGLSNTPQQISRTGLSYSFSLGFIKDLPVNERRNIGFGLGLGYGLNSYKFNVTEDVTEDLNELKSNKVAMHTIEVPIELRFRTSTSQRYDFWRVYPGFKMAYVFATNSKLKQREDFLVEDVVEINKFLYGVTLSVGYNKWNFHAYYGLNSLFNEAKNNSYNIDIHDLRLGIIFYIL